MAYRLDKGRIRNAVYAGVSEGLERVAVRFQNHIVSMLSRPGGGPRAVRYWTDKKGKRRRSRRYARSLPGQPPAVQTGTLRRSWQRASTRATVLHSIAVVRVGSNIPYARYLEEGTHKMRKRPYVAPVMARFTPDRVSSLVMGTVRRRLRTLGVTK